jgi:predicted DNA binding CopG/RHH family protein
MKKAIQLDDEERDLLESYEAGEWQPTVGSADLLLEAARATLAKSRRINLRLSEMDLVSLQRRAAREGIPAQTLMGSILHKYATGILREAS